MKRGTRAILSVEIGLDMDNIESIEFIFVQDRERLMFNYPSQNAVAADGMINLYWTQPQTFMFSSKKPVYMDTHVHVKDSDTNPKTDIVEIEFSPTLFKLEEIMHNRVQPPQDGE